MKFTVSRSALNRAIKNIAGVVEKKNTMPILAHAKLEVGDKLKITGSSMDIEATATVECEVAQAGEITVPVYTLADIVNKLPNGDVKVSLEDSKLKVSSGRSRFTLPTLPVGDFPSMNMESDVYFDIPAATFGYMLQKSEFCASDDETRYYLNGVCLDFKDDATYSVATDGHKMAKIAGVKTVDHAQIIIPSKTVMQVLKLLDGCEIVTVSLSDNLIGFNFGDAAVLSRLIDGKFPDYGRVIPEGNDKKMSVNVADMLGAIERVGSIANSKTRAVKCTIADGTMTIEAKSSEFGEASEVIDVDADFDLIIGFNGRYMSDILKSLECEAVDMSFSTESGPIRIEDEDQLYIVMPLRV